MLLQMVLFHSFMAESYSIVYVCHIFVPSSVNGHLGCFHILAVVSSVAMNVVVHVSFIIMAFSRLPRWHSDKESACQAGAAGDMGLILGSGRSPGEGNSNLLQCSCLENPRDGEAWLAAVSGVTQSRTRLKRLSSSSSSRQYSCLENPMNRGAWWVTVHRVAKSWTWLIDWACTLDICPAVRLLDHMVTLFQFLRKFHIALHSGCTNIHSHQQCRRIPFPPHALKHLWYNIICRLFDMAILTGVTW